MNAFDSRYMSLKIEKLEQIINKEKKVVAVARELHVTRKTVHQWLNRYKRFGSEGLVRKQRTKTVVAHNRTSSEIEQLVIDLSRTYWQDGVETLTDRLYDEYRITLNASTIYRILQRNNIRYTE